MKIAGIAGLALAALGWVLEPRVFAFAWLAALVVWLHWPLGSLALLLVHRLTGGGWGIALTPGLLRGVRSLWLLLPAVLPLLFTLTVLYPWARSGGYGVYLHLPFFAVRGVLYLVVWLGLGALVLRATERGTALQDGVPAAVAVLGLALLAVSVTFAAIDLTMSLEPSYSFAAYGLVAMAGAVAMAVAVAVFLGVGAMPPALLGDAGALLLGSALLWAYLDFVQFLIVAESDLTSDAPWYAQRLQGGWLIAAGAISALLVAIPVLTLLSRRMRRSPPVLTGLAGLMIVGAVLRGWWIVLPAAPRGLSWIDFACVLAFAAGSLAVPVRRAGAVRVG